MAQELHCYRCGASLAALSLPLARLDECPQCTVQLHVCRMCRHFDPAVTKQCREDDAEQVREKSRANFCDYFSPSESAHDPGFVAADEQARSRLDALFSEPGDDAAAGDAAASAADDLFK